MIVSKWIEFDIKCHFNTCIPPTSNKVSNKQQDEVQNIISSQDSYNFSKKLLMSINNIDYNNLVSTLNHSMNSKLFPSYYLITKHRPVLDSGIIEFIDQFKHLISDKDKATRMIERI